MMSEKLRDEAREIALKISVGSKLASFHRGPEPTNKEYLLVAQQYLELLRENGELRKILTLMGFDNRNCICHVSSSDGYHGTSHPDFCIRYQEARKAFNEGKP